MRDYDSIIGPENSTIDTTLRDNGYATSQSGKGHNTPAEVYVDASCLEDVEPSALTIESLYSRSLYLFVAHNPRVNSSRRCTL
jgi:hypothetical protein